MASTIAVSILADMKDLQKNLDKAEGSVKDFASAADAQADKARKSLDSIGEGADGVASASSQAAGGLGDLGGAISALPGPLGALGSGMEAAAPAIMGVTGAADLLNLAATKFPPLAKAMALGQRLVNAAMAANPIGLVVAGLALLGAAFVLAYKKSETFRNIVNGAWSGIKAGLQVAWNVVKPIFNLYGKYLSLIGSAAVAMKNVAVGAFTGIWNTIKGLPGKVRGLGSDMLSAGKAIMTKLFDGFGNAAGKAGDFASAIGAKIKEVVNTQVIDRINKGLDVLEVAIGKLPGVGRPNLSIPHLASGGITTGPMLALIGDNPGGREAVIPLDKYDIGGTTYNIYVTTGVGDPVAIGKEVKRYLAAADNAGARTKK